GPAELLDLGLEARRDHRAVGALAADDRAGLRLRVELARVEGSVHPVRETLAVPRLGGVALEDAPILARVAFVALDPGDLRVHVGVQAAVGGDGAAGRKDAHHLHAATGTSPRSRRLGGEGAARQPADNQAADGARAADEHRPPVYLTSSE